MAQIQLLDNSTIDKIAAGEVVERPASVVKELVENAIDANATAITVEIKEGGTSFIRVTDNGSGIEKKQVRTALLRHATSKIKCVEDLFTVKSLGFRGEALSSITSVSQTELVSKTSEDLTGARLLVEGTKEVSFEEIGAPNGTTILVRNLFFNTPVRHKFLKSAATEGSYVTDLMEHLALSNQYISFTYILNHQTKFHTSGNGDLKEIIYRIYGRETAAQLIPVAKEMKGIKVSGFLGKPELNKANRGYETYFVNRRYIKSEILSKAIEEGYKTYLMQHKYPLTVLHIEIDPQKIDINVHPTKMEIRFTDKETIFEFLKQAVSEALKKPELIPKVTFAGKDNVEENKRTQDIVVPVPEPFEEKRIAKSYVRETSNYQENIENTANLQEIMQNSIGNKVLGGILNQDIAKNEDIHANIIKSKEHILVEKPTQMDFFEEKLLTKEAKEEYKILGQIFDTYWLLSFADKLYFVDQHAAHEKVKYERILKRIKDKKVETQMLQPPIIVSLNGKEEAVYNEYKKYLAAIGFETEEFGGNEYAIRSVPIDLFGHSAKDMFEEILAELSQTHVKGTPVVIEEKIASMACKAAVKGNHKISENEIKVLLEELLELDNPYHCPHGRPTIISMTKYEVERKFKRII